MFNGNHFFNCYQPFSIQQPNDPAWGNNLVFRKNVFTGTGRVAIEFGSQGTQHFNGTAVDTNYFDAFKRDPSSDIDHVIAISLVGSASTDTDIHDNFIRRGTDPGSQVWSPAIEMYGDGPCTTNTVDGWQNAGYAYGSNGHFFDNILYLSGPFTNNGSGVPIFGPETVVTSPPVDPGWPVRATW